ncbi:MAG: ATP-dependent DNA helicase RecG [Burkholderiales bacterium RIFCSPLOWO2_12_67_14]|nr:MAG: ATP-dependent DNA helicase RecG [Burkholderiales bacterium RIFCSPLOWO2_02_FULL_67_64]OGB47563.1 MAG: ATP-dependent DNA helicase RecG [Burkholderiales bacterium RIFCSPLOWO2_12_67_14]OGB77412.1 MAG: ATP-dependent DNA helicase RecG [Burkholderiales bacterium RIFCSPLOWO2_12_FULL_67_210]
MPVTHRKLNTPQYEALLAIEESHFIDLKGSEITPANLTKTASAFCNTGGGELFLGIEESVGLFGKQRKWNGLKDQEAANPFFQVIERMSPLGNHYAAEFLEAEGATGVVLHLTFFKTQDILTASSGKVHVRRSSQNLPVEGEEAIERLKYDKGIKSFEDEVTGAPLSEISNSIALLGFLLEVVPASEPEEWLSKQRVTVDGRATVAGVLLYSDLPQSILPKRSAVKILRYQTKEAGERDFLVFDPLTIEGPVYSLVYDSVEKCKEIIEGIKKLGPSGLEPVVYPEEALHEVLTNAVLHRDYSIAADVQVRIFDNRLEIESPGRLPGHVTLANITRTQFARNPKLVRLINKFKEPPNKDVGEGLRTTFEAMDKLRLKEPLIEEREGSVVVILRHEGLGSPEQLVMQYLENNPEITNSIARELTGIKSENVMKQVFYRLRDSNQIEQIPGRAAHRAAWRRKAA